VKDGASWAALEYMKWCKEEGKDVQGAKEITVVPAGIVYTDKTKYRSVAIME
jgi:glycerol-3-phosphate O-acyltransferase / dihydroxyacetone phosphate acyltransferase